MGITIGDAILWIRGDDSKLDGDLAGATKKAERMIGAIGDKMKAIGGAMTLAITTPIIGAFTASTAAASDFNEAASKAQVVFGDNAKAVEAFASTTARAYGISRREATSAAAAFGNLFVTMGLSQSAAAKMSIDIVKLAADLASFNNISPDEALEKLRAGLVGEAEPLRALGVQINEAAVQAKALEMGLGGVSGELTEAEKVQARYALIMEQTATAQGDFARTSDGAANQTRILKAQVDDLAVTFGQNLLPLTQQVLKFFNDLLEKFNNLTPTQQKMVIAFALMVAAVGPFLFILGQVFSIVGSVIGIIGALGGAGITVSGAVGAVSGALTGLAGALPAIVALIMSPIGLLIGAIGLLIITLVTLGPKAWESLKMLAQLFVLGWQEVLRRAQDAIKNLLGILFAGIANIGRQVGQKARELGGNLANGIRDGIKAAWDNIKSYLSGALDALLAWIRSKILARSPSKLWADMVGAPMAQGIGVGFQQSINNEVMATVAAGTARLGNAAQSASVQVGHIEYHGGFSQGEMEMLDRRAENIAQNAILKYIQGGVA